MDVGEFVGHGRCVDKGDEVPLLFLPHDAAERGLYSMSSHFHPMVSQLVWRPCSQAGLWFRASVHPEVMWLPLSEVVGPLPELHDAVARLHKLLPSSPELNLMTGILGRVLNSVPYLAPRLSVSLATAGTSSVRTPQDLLYLVMYSR